MSSVLGIVGPTAVGKSAWALDLADLLGGEIINGDALQVYRGFDLGTAKPTAREQARCPHHLLDILDPWEPYSAGEFVRRARSASEEIRSRGRLPIVVGGSGLYLRALLQGISPVPPGDPAIRQRLRQRLASEGLPALKLELRALDSETEARLADGDTQRVLRALEVVLASGVPLSAWIERQPFGRQSYSACLLGLTLPRSILYDRIERRVARMFDSGWLEEVRGLLDRGLSPDLPAFQAIGYRQLARHLAGELRLEEAASEIVRATRRFAKRQMTWFRREPGVVWFDSSQLSPRSEDIIAYLRREGVGSGEPNA